jgi:hypothetical protein
MENVMTPDLPAPAVSSAKPERMMKDVHTEHCCLQHGCKYGKDDICTVVTRKAPQSYPCEMCEFSRELPAPSAVSESLLPCAFCGGAPKLTYIGNARTPSRKVTVKCSGCRMQLTHAARVQDFAWLESHIARDWNRRPARELPSRDELREVAWFALGKSGMPAGLYLRPSQIIADEIHAHLARITGETK